MWIKASYNQLLTLSESMYNPPAGSISRYLFGVDEIEGFGYSRWTQQIEDEINFEYEIVSELPITEEI